MPDPFERHARSKRKVDQEPRSRQRREAAEEDGGSSRADDPLITGKRAPGKKNPSLCKAAHWKGPHQPEIRIRIVHDFLPTCYWRDWALKDQPYWVCFHREACSGCGKTLRHWLPPEECPDFRPIGPREVEAARARRRDLITAYGQRKPVITGPQGYRRTKNA